VYNLRNTNYAATARASNRSHFALIRAKMDAYTVSLVKAEEAVRQRTAPGFK